MRTSPDFETFMRKVEKTLPQFALIRPEDARLWWESLDEDKFNDEDWHLGRLRKIGGSESGILVAPAYGEPAPFDQTPAQLYDRKLMRSVLEQNIAMRFGHEHEDIARKMYEAKLFEKGWERDTEGLKQLADHIKQDQESSMAFSPDDLFVLKNEKGQVQRRLLPDYKSPYAGNVPGLRGEKQNPDFSYIVQLHHGKTVCEEAGLPIDDLRLCILDHPDNLAHPKESRLITLDIDYDPQLAADICQYCDAMIDNVRSGMRPLPVHLYNSDKDIAKLKQDLVALRKLQEKLVRYSIEEKSLAVTIKNVRDNMAAITKEFVSPDGTVNKEELGIQVSPRISLVVAKGHEDELKKQLSEDDFEKVPDMDALTEFLKLHGKSMEDFQKKGDPKMDVVLENPERRQKLLAEGVLEPRISFAVPAKLTVDDLKNYDSPEQAVSTEDHILRTEHFLEKPGAFRALLWHPESVTLWEVRSQKERDMIINDDGCVEDVTGEPVYEEAFRLGDVPDLNKKVITGKSIEKNETEKAMYAVSVTKEAGLKGEFTAGPFFTVEEAKSMLHVGSFCFKIDGENPEMIFKEEEEADQSSREASSHKPDNTHFVELDESDDIDLGSLQDQGTRQGM